jgi:hypothetical protein
MKILAAIMDVVHVKYHRKYKQFAIHKIRKCLVYDPKVTRWDFGKKVKDD